jgi:hypothetical protein
MKTVNLTRANLETINAMITHYKVEVPEGANLAAKRAALVDHFGDKSVDAEVVLLALAPVQEVPATPIKKEGKAKAKKEAEALPEPPAEIYLCEKCQATAELKRRGKHLCGQCAVAMDVKRKGKEAFADLAARTPEGQKVNRSHLASAFTWPLSREIAEYTGEKAGQVARTVYQYTTALIKATFPDQKKVKATASAK